MLSHHRPTQGHLWSWDKPRRNDFVRTAAPFASDGIPPNQTGPIYTYAPPPPPPRTKVVAGHCKKEPALKIHPRQPRSSSLWLTHPVAHPPCGSPGGRAHRPRPELRTLGLASNNPRRKPLNYPGVGPKMGPAGSRGVPGVHLRSLDLGPSEAFRACLGPGIALEWLWGGSMVLGGPGDHFFKKELFGQWPP